MLLEFRFVDFIEMFMYTTILIVIYVGFYSSGYAMYLKQLQFLRKYKNQIHDLNDHSVIIFQNSFKGLVLLLKVSVIRFKLLLC